MVRPWPCRSPSAVARYSPESTVRPAPSRVAARTVAKATSAKRTGRAARRTRASVGATRHVDRRVRVVVAPDGDDAEPPAARRDDERAGHDLDAVGVRDLG